MKAFIANKVKDLLSHKKATFAVLSLCITGRILHLIYFYNIRVDASYQVMATQNFIYGHGISTAKVLAEDLSKTIYEPLINWPPGYSLLLAPFYALFNPNYIAAGLALDIISAVTLIFTTRKIVKLFDIPLYLVNIYTLLTSFFIYYFYFIASSDSIAIAFFVIAFYYALLILKTNAFWIRRTIILSICLLTCAFIKYLFIPVAFIIPLFLLVKGLSDQHTKLKQAGFISFAILTIGTGALLLYQKAISGSVGYISAPERGFFPEHLLDAYPFFPGSFIKPDTVVVLFSQQPGLENSTLLFYQWIHILFVFLVLIYMLRRLLRYGFKQLLLVESFFYLSFFLSAAITLLLMVLSVRVAKEEILPGSFWTYVEEPRYYGLINVLLHLGVFVLYQLYRLKSLNYIRTLFYVFLLVLLPEAFRGFFFTANRILLFNKEEYSWQLENRFQKYADGVIKEALQKHRVENIVITGSSYYFNHRVSLYSHAPILTDVTTLNKLSILNTKKPVLLLAILHETQLPSFQPFLLSRGREADGYFNGFSFYIFYVTPH